MDDPMQLYKQYEGSSSEDSIHKLAFFGSFGGVRRQVQKGASFDLPDEKGFTPLHLSVYSGYYEITKYLIEKGADINSTTRNGVNMLYTAVECGRVDALKLLLKSGANAHKDPSKPYGFMILYMAAQSGEREMVEDLLVAGAKVNALDDNDNSALAVAVYYGHIGVVKALIKKGADVTIGSRDGKSIRHMAQEEGGDLAKLIERAYAKKILSDKVFSGSLELS